MTKPASTESIENATGRPWGEWVQELDTVGARALPHADLARLVNERLEGKVENPGWWAQGITVAYEQHIGRRLPGQLADGTFEVSVSKTVAVTRNEFFPKVVNWFESQADFSGYDSMKPRSSETPKRSNWRCDFADKSKFSATVEESGNKSKLVLAHTAIPTKREADDWKEFWRGIINELAEG